MNDIQKQKAIALGRCTFLPGSYPKRFARNIAGQVVRDPDKELTDKQAAYLDDLFHMYRKQIGALHGQLCNCKAVLSRRLLTSAPAE